MLGFEPFVAGAVFAEKYRIVRVLDTRGEVYEVEELGTGRGLALKVVQPSRTDEDARRAFVSEACISAMLDSESAVDVVAAGIDARTGLAWLAMELLRGETLDERVRRGVVGQGELAEIFAQLGDVLGKAHARGIVHRDLRPEKLYLATARGSLIAYKLKLLDLGVARIALGSTEAWRAPEQSESNGTVDPATDVWALGLIAYYALTGHHYWSSRSAEPVSYREFASHPLVPVRDRAREAAVDHLLPDGFEDWFARCVARDRRARFSDASAAVAALLPILRSAPPSVRGFASAPSSVGRGIGASPGAAFSSPQRSPHLPMAIGIAIIGAGSALYLLTSVSADLDPPRASPLTAVPRASAPEVPKVADLVVPPASASPAPSPSSVPSGFARCGEFGTDYSAAMRGRDYRCVRAILFPRLHAGTINSSEARYLKAACGALGDHDCEKRASAKI